MQSDWLFALPNFRQGYKLLNIMASGIFDDSLNKVNFFFFRVSFKQHKEDQFFFFFFLEKATTVGGASSTEHQRLVEKSSVFKTPCMSVHSVRQDDGGGMDRSTSVEEEVNTAADDSLHTDRGERSKVMPYGCQGN